MTRPALERLIDYAGLFPPAQLPLGEAVEEYEQARASATSWMLGRFIVPAARLDALREIRTGAEPRELSVIAAPGAFDAVAGVRREGWATIGSIEVPLGDASIADCARQLRKAGLADVPVYVELARGRLEMDELALRGLRAKVRCGGVDPAAYPSVGELAAFIVAAVTARVAFKATAGLHHPVRHFNREAGVTMHGFLNVLLASAAAGRVERAGVERILAEEDPAALVLRDEAELARARRERLISYGSCSFEEPVADLRALHILPAI